MAKCFVCGRTQNQCLKAALKNSDEPEEVVRERVKFKYSRVGSEMVPFCPSCWYMR